MEYDSKMKQRKGKEEKRGKSQGAKNLKLLQISQMPKTNTILLILNQG